MSARVEINHAFANPIFQVPLDGFGEHRDALRALALNEPRGGSLTAQGGEKTKKDLHTVDHPAIRWLCRELLAAASAATKLVTSNALELGIAELWANVNPAGAWNEPHLHRMPWAAVIFVDAERASAPGDPTAALPAGHLVLMNPLISAMPYGVESFTGVAPRDGWMVLFPGYVPHYVTPHTSPELRISYASNLASQPHA